MLIDRFNCAQNLVSHSANVLGARTPHGLGAILETSTSCTVCVDAQIVIVVLSLRLLLLLAATACIIDVVARRDLLAVC